MKSVKNEVLQLTTGSIRRGRFDYLGVSRKIIKIVKQFTLRNRQIVNRNTRAIREQLERII